MLNKHLNEAKKKKDDEFYTQMSDIENELKHYTEYLKDKIIYCNCDDPTFSNFWVFFHQNFGLLKLKKLISTHYSKGCHSYKAEYSGGDDYNLTTYKKTPLNGDGDFRSQECIEILKQSDIVVTNPPFSVFSDYFSQLIEYNKFFIIIAPLYSLLYERVFDELKKNKISAGYTRARKFITKSGTTKEVYTAWITNLPIKKCCKLNLVKKYVPDKYPKYDNYDAINVDKVSDIPNDYFGLMGVPISLISNFCPQQFEIVGCNESFGRPSYFPKSINMTASINGREKFKRLLIKRVKNDV